MRVVLLTSTGIRHAYIARTLAARAALALIIREEKAYDASFADHPDRDTIRDHFARFEQTEREWFGSAAHWDGLPCVQTLPRGVMNSAAIADSVRGANPDVVVVFGCGIIRSPLLEALPTDRTWNLHQGLSPYYRGSGTNFWPFVEGRFEYLGATLHLLSAGVDAGAILAQTRPTIERTDTLHSIGCKTIVATAEMLSDALALLAAGTPPAAIPQWESGRVFRRAALTGGAVAEVRRREAAGDVATFVDRRAAGLVSPVQLVTLNV